MKATLPILALLAGAVIGWFFHNLAAEPQGNDIAATKPGSEMGVPHKEHEALVGRFEKEIKLLKATVEAERKKSKNAETGDDELKDELAKLKKANDEMKAQLGDVDAKNAERMVKIEERFKKLSGMGISALVANNEIGKLVADLLQQGQSGRDAVLALLNSEDDGEKMLGVVLMLQGMASVESIDPLAEMALTGDESMRAMASQVLLRMDDKEAVPALERIVAQTEDEGVKVNSLFGLARQGHTQGVQQLVDYYNDENSQHADVLTQSLLILRNPESQPLIDAVVQRHADRGESTRNAIGEAAIGFYAHVKTPSARQSLQNMVDDPNASASLRQQAQDALNNM
ncbi:MAG: HEAT repeat protein [Planctomycetota bacterium]|jgi:HEAT repeat protein